MLFVVLTEYLKLFQTAFKVFFVIFVYQSCTIFTRDSMYAIARICHGNSVCPSVSPSVCHTGGSVKNSWS